jgi:hypothetical protein
MSGELTMSKNLFLIGVMTAFAAGCTQSDRTSAPATSQPAKLTEARATADKCVLTQPIKSPAPENTEGGPADTSVQSWYSWFVNADRTIWMLDQPRTAGQRTKTAWFRPARTKLEVTGRRLDAAAPPLAVRTSPTGDEYRHMFQPSTMTFPTEGCWEITAKAGASEARFVVKVQPKPTTTMPSDVSSQ